MKKCIRLLGFSFLLVIVLFLTFRILAWKDTTGDYISSIEQLKNTKKNTVDVVFLGSSHVYCGVAPHILWQEFGIPAFDMSVSGMDKYSEYYYTEYFLKFQKPKLICIDTFSLTFDRGDVLANEYRNMLSMPSSLTQFKLVDDYVEDKEKALSYKLKWPIVHTRYKELGRKDFISPVFNRVGKGENLTPIGEAKEGSNYTANTDIEEPVTVSAENKKLLDKYISLSKKTGIPILFFSVPYEMTAERASITLGIEEYLKGVDGIFFMNGSKEVGDLLGIYEDFYDRSHLNYSGALKFTSWLGNYLTELVVLENHSGDVNYSGWDDDVIYHNVLSANYSVNMTASYGETQELLREVMNHDFMTYVVSFGEKSLPEDCENELKTLLNIPETESLKNRAFTGNGFNSLMLDEAMETDTINLNRYDAIRLQRSPSGGYDICIHTEEDLVTKQADNSISIIVYDNYNQELLGNWCR